MKILLVGYGQMGRMIEESAAARGHAVVARVDSDPSRGDRREILSADLAAADVVVEFAHASGVLPNAKAFAAAQKPAVVGSTGWDKDRDAVRAVVEAAGTGYVYGTNFCVGAHILFALAEQAMTLMDGLPDYDVMVTEIHHKLKKDSPSGTALTLARRMLAKSSRKKTIQTERLDRAIREDELHVSSVRGGSVPGTHSVLFDSPFDTIEISHTARNRGGFALGAVLAAEWIVALPTRKGFINVEDFVASRFSL